MRYFLRMLLKDVAMRSSLKLDISLFALCSLLFVQSSFAATWYVDSVVGDDGNVGDVEISPFRSIQKAIDVATEGDKIVVGDGAYTPISTGNKRLMITSRNGALSTIIDGGRTNRCAMLGINVTDTNTVVRGFTFQNGSSESTNGGGGVFAGSLVNCVIKNNRIGYGDGGGVRGGQLYQCIIEKNKLWHVRNETATPKGAGVADARCINCVIVNNDASSHHLLSVSGAYKSELDNCIVAANLCYGGYRQIYLCTIVNSCIPEADTIENGNTLTDCVIGSPMLVDVQRGDYRLLSSSPCIDAGSSSFLLGTEDFLDRSRVVGSAVDIGAYEWYAESTRLSLDVDVAGIYGKTWYVDSVVGNDGNVGDVEISPFRSIQKAIDVATEGDKIVVGDGAYTPISTGNKRLMITSRNGALSTIIDGGRTNRCAMLGINVTDTNTVVRGFTFQNGSSESTNGGGGVFAGSLVNCVIKNNRIGYGDGGGVRGGQLYQCIIEKNKLWHVRNETATPKGAGVADARCINCVIVNNDASSHHLLSVSGAYKSELDNCIVAANLCYGGYRQIYLCTIVNSCIPEADTIENGNTLTDCVIGSPMLVDVQRGDYRLLSSSPCIDAGSSSFLLGTEDFLDRSRVVGSAVDIGAYELQERDCSIEIFARQRYPWNGKVDMHFIISGDAEGLYAITFVAKDLIGGTNMVMQTVHKSDGSIVNMTNEKLPPGTYNWVWDAAADLPDGFQCERMAIEMTAK